MIIIPEHLEQAADFLIADVQNPDVSSGFMDALGTLDGLDENNLRLLAMALARRLPAAG
jgi:hypothetical protein